MATTKLLSLSRLNTIFSKIKSYIDTKLSSYVKTSSLSSYSTKTYVDTKISDLVGGAPETLDTLNEIAAALGNDANLSATLTAQIGSKANSADVYTKTAANSQFIAASQKGATNGVAPLENGKVPRSKMNGDIMLFDSMVSGVTVEMTSSGKGPSDSGCSVVYDTTKKTFLLKDGTKYYGTFNGGQLYGGQQSGGYKPYGDALYVLKSNGSVWYWDGAALVEGVMQEATEAEVAAAASAVFGS